MRKAKRTPKRSKSAPKTPRDRNTEQRILDAARAVFIRRGTAGARMQEIAAEAGVNQALLHYYFRSKERLSAAVFEQFARRLLPALTSTLGAEIPLDEKIDRVFDVYCDNLSRDPFVPAYLISELHHHPERVEQLLVAVVGGAPGNLLPPLFRRLGHQIDDRVSEGTMRPIAPEQFAANLIALCVFPFAARPMLSILFGMNDVVFARFIERRRTELPEFFRSALRA